jgi:dipeptidase E
LLEAVRQSNFDIAVKNRLSDKNFLYIGSSAGSILVSPDIDYISPMGDKSKAHLENTMGLNFIPFSFLPHVNHPTMGNAAEVIKLNYQNQKYPIISLTDEQALYIDGNRIEIL